MIGSKFTQTANRITQEITDRSNADQTLTSSIQQEAGRITQIVTAVGENGEVTAASIITSVNNGSSDIKLNANHIQITGNTGILGALTVEGVVVADDIFSETGTLHDIYCNAISVGGNINCDYDLVMSSTSDISTGTITAEGLVTCNYGLEIAGSTTAEDISAESLDVTYDITSGGTVAGDTISGNSIDAPTYAGYKVNGTSIGLGDAIKSISLTGPTNNVYTLTATQLDGDTVQIGTFSRATSLSGRWSGRYYTVTATPQNETKTGIVYDGLVPTGSVTKSGKNVSKDFIVYSDDGEGNADEIIMQKSVTINANDVFEDGVIEGENHFTSAGRVYTRGTSAHYFGSAGTIYEAKGHIYLKLHTASETPTGSWYSVQSGSAGATLTLYTRSSRTDLYVSGSGTPYYTSTGFHDNYYTYTG